MNLIEGENSANLTRRGAGRPKGSPNKTTAILKDALLQAAQEADEGGLVGYLRRQANENPGPFLTLLGKVLPLQLEGDAEKPMRMVISWDWEGSSEALPPGYRILPDDSASPTTSGLIGGPRLSLIDGPRLSRIDGPRLSRIDGREPR